MAHALFLSPGGQQQSAPDLMGDLLDLGDDSAGPLSAADEQANSALPPSSGQPQYPHALLANALLVIHGLDSASFLHGV